MKKQQLATKYGELAFSFDIIREELTHIVQFIDKKQQEFEGMVSPNIDFDIIRQMIKEVATVSDKNVTKYYNEESKVLSQHVEEAENLVTICYYQKAKNWKIVAKCQDVSVQVEYEEYSIMQFDSFCKKFDINSENSALIFKEFDKFDRLLSEEVVDFDEFRQEYVLG